MKCYGSFLVRCWPVGDGQRGEKAVIGIEHIQSGAGTRVASLSEAERRIFEVCRKTRPAAAEAPDADAAREE